MTRREPDPVTDAALAPVLAELRRLEPLFALAEAGATREDIDRLLVADFWEVGASGGRYGRDFVLEVLAGRQREPRGEAWETKDFHCREVAPGNYLLTYTLVQPARLTRRASLWRRTSGGWTLLYHQGTVA